MLACYIPKDPNEKKTPCGMCKRWDANKGKCKDHAKRRAEWSAEDEKIDRMMRSNRGVWVDG